MKKKFYLIGLIVVAVLCAVAVSCTKEGKGCTCDTYGEEVEWTAEMVKAAGFKSCSELENYFNEKTSAFTGEKTTTCK